MQAARPEHADAYSFEHDPRARMFARARQGGTITDVESFMRFLRYNSRSDPIAKGNACIGISARCDLNPGWKSDYDCWGAVDAKVIQARQHFDDLSFFAVSSPTFDREEHAFSWSRQNVSVDGCKPQQHFGHPDTFNFPWYTLTSRAGHAAESNERLTGEVSEAMLLSPSSGLLMIIRAAVVVAAAFAAVAAFHFRLWAAFIGNCSTPEQQGYVQIDA